MRQARVLRTDAATGNVDAMNRRQSLLEGIGRGSLYVIAVILSAAFLLPFVWMLSSSLKPNYQVYAVPPVWIPSPAIWRNFPDALDAMGFLTLLKNTMIIVVFTVFGAVLSSSVVAYGFSRLRWPGRDALFFVCLATLMIPYQVTLVPLYIIFSRLHWINTFRPLIVPAFFGVPFFIFLLRQFFLTIPEEISDAARIDGASEMGILLKIILPLSRPALMVVALFQFISTWNDFLGPIIYLSDPSKYTLAIGLAAFSGDHAFQFAFQMAGATVTVLPIVVLFFFAQRAFIEGISMTGVKG